MIRKTGIFGIAVTIFFLAMTSCSTTTLDSVWKDPHYQGGKLKRVVVIGVARKETSRRSFEDKFVTQLKTYGTDAISSYTILSPEEKLDKAAVEAKIKALGPGAVLVTRLDNIKKEKEYVTGVGTALGYWEEYEVVSLETNIYNTQTEKLIWSSSIDTILEGSVEAAIESVIKVIIKSLSDNQLI